MADEYDIIFRKDFWGNWKMVIEKRPDNTLGYILIFILIIFLLFCFLLTSPVWMALLGFGMNPHKKYVSSILTGIAMMYFMMDIKYEWISSMFFYGYTNDAGEFNEPLFSKSVLHFVGTANVGATVLAGYWYYVSQQAAKAFSNDSKSRVRNSETSSSYEDDFVQRDLEMERGFIEEDNIVPIVSQQNVALEKGEYINGVHIIENKPQFSATKLGSVTGQSGWGGLAYQKGLKKAKEKAVVSVKQLKGDVMHIIRISEPMGGVKVHAQAYRKTDGANEKVARSENVKQVTTTAPLKKERDAVPVQPEKTTFKSYTLLEINWEGMSLLVDANTSILINGKLHSKQSTKKGFQLEIPIKNKNMQVELKLRLKSSKYSLTFEEGKNYRLDISYDKNWGRFSKEFKLSVIE